MTGRPRPFPLEAEVDVARAAELHRLIRAHYTDLGPLLAAYREAIGRARAKGATLRAIAERVGVSRTAIADAEK